MDGVFECKTCNRRFASFQALGGHRTSHSRPKAAGGEGGEVGKTKASHVHECSICGSRFAMGQALGGHMRRHRDRGAVVQRSSQPEELDLLSVFEHGVSGNLCEYKVVRDGEECRLLQLFV